MRRIAVSVARERIADLLTHVRHRRERVILTRHGRALGAIVPMEDVERLRELDATKVPRHMAGHRTAWRRVTDAIHHRQH